MKILMLLEHEFPGDVRVDREVDSLYEEGINIDVAICSTNKNCDDIKDYKWGKLFSKYIPKLTLKFSALALTFPFYFAFWEKYIDNILKNNSYHYIHLHDLPLIKVAYKLSQKYNIPLVVDLHENRPEIMKLYKHVNSFPGKYLISIKTWGEYQKKYVKLVDHLIVITPEAKSYYTDLLDVDAKKISVVPNYVNPNFKLGDYDKDFLDKLENKKTLVYFGDISERRGILELIEVAILHKSNPDFHFIFIGAGSGLSILQEMITKYNLRNVDLLGYINIDNALMIIKSCSIGICPFHRNIHHDTTYANKMFQYMGLGLPILVSDCPAQAKIVTTEDAGLVFKAGDYKDLNEKLLELVSDKENFDKISSNNKLLISQKYNWAIATNELLDIYH